MEAPATTVPGQGSRAKRWVFTLLNWTQDELTAILDAAREHAEYCVVGRETAPTTGTPHLQGYIEWRAACRFQTCKNRLGSPRVSVRIARADAQKNRTYCTKEDDFEEIGTCPTVGQGRRSDLERFFEWTDEFATDNGRPPTTPECARQHPTIIARFPRVLEVVRLRTDRALFHESPVPREWQQQLRDRLEGPADDRKIIFVVDEDGGLGKSWFVRWFLDLHPSDTQLFRPARVQDMAHSVRERTKVFLFDVPRNSMQFLQTSFLEQLKDRLIYSPKYNSVTKSLIAVPHVVVFCNEHPADTTAAMSADRYEFLDT